MSKVATAVLGVIIMATVWYVTKDENITQPTIPAASVAVVATENEVSEVVQLTGHIVINKPNQ